MRREDVTRSLAGAAWRGAVAAMAMSGVRELTVSLGLVERPPPEEIAEEAVPELLAAVPAAYREAAVELAHWGYGAATGAVFARLPGGLRRRVWSGPAYGLAVWALFEAGTAPLLGLQPRSGRPLAERAAIALDHVLYGLVVAGRP